ncbi:MAG: FMN-binding protein, partial [Eubacteriales bacterium]|nr:FMN-binding protein [Eubacteriales bacterium]
VQGYAVPFAGPGLWGGIEGYLGINPDRTQILGLVFTQQNETPGLGGRIEEPIFRDQFRGVPIQPGTELAFGASASQDIDAVTGATATSNAVLKILNQLLGVTLSQLEVMSGE